MEAGITVSIECDGEMSDHNSIVSEGEGTLRYKVLVLVLVLVPSYL